jgi:hypothetical protein
MKAERKEGVMEKIVKLTGSATDKQDGYKPVFKIENKPVTRPGYVKNKYPFDKMKVGQSFYFDRTDCDVQALRTAAYQCGARTGTKFSILKEGNGYRCGRVK